MTHRKLAGMWPAPVYVGTFADGEIARMSFWSQQGKPIDFDRGRRGVMLALGNARTRGQAKPIMHAPYGPYAFIPPEFRRPSYRQLLAETRPVGMRGSLLQRGIAWSAAPPPGVLLSGPCPPARDITRGHVEHDGVTYPDPHFAPALAQPAKAPKRARAELAHAMKLLERVVAHFGNAIPPELAELRGFLDHRAAA